VRIAPALGTDSKQLAFISKEVLEGNKEKEKAKPSLSDGYPGGEPKQNLHDAKTE